MMLSQNTKELVNIYNLYFGEGDVAENIIMVVLGYNVFCIGFECTIYELVIIRICRDKMKMVIDLHHLCIWQIEQSLDNVGCDLWPNFLGKDFFVFGQNVIGNTKRIFPINEISPDGIILAATRKRHQQTVGVKNDVHHCL